MTCIDCGAEVHTKSPRCEPCRVKNLKKRQAECKSRFKAKHEKIKYKATQKHCLRCFELFEAHAELQRICHSCNREDGYSKQPKVQRFMHPQDQWLSGQPITKFCQHEY